MPAHGGLPPNGSDCTDNDMCMKVCMTPIHGLKEIIIIIKK